MSATEFDRLTMVSTNEYSDFLPRVLTILKCVADSAGVDDSATQSAHEVLVELGEDTQLASKSFSISFSANENCVLTELTHASPVDTTSHSGHRPALRRWISESVELVRNKAGLTIRMLKKRRKTASRVSAFRPSAHHRN